MQLIKKTITLIILISVIDLNAQNWVKSSEISIYSGSNNYKNTHVQNNRVYLESMNFTDDSIKLYNNGSISNVLTRKFIGDKSKIVHKAISLLNEDLTYLESVAFESSVYSRIKTDYSGLDGVGVYVSGYLEDTLFLLYDKGDKALPFEGKGRYIYKFDSNLNFMNYYFIHSNELNFMQFAGEDRSGGVYYYGSFQDSVFVNSPYKLYKNGPSQNGYIVKYNSSLEVKFTLLVSGMVQNYFTIYYPNSNFVAANRVALNLYGNSEIKLNAKNGTKNLGSNGSKRFNKIVTIDTNGNYINHVTINLDGQTPMGSCPVITTDNGSIVYIQASSSFTINSLPKLNAGFCYLLLDDNGELSNYFYQNEGLSQPYIASDSSFYIGGLYKCINDSFNADFFNSISDVYKLKCPNNNNLFLGKYNLSGKMEWNRPVSGFVRAFSLGKESNLLLETLGNTDVDLSDKEHWISANNTLFSKYNCMPISFFTVQSRLNNHIKFWFNGDLNSNWEWDFGDGKTSKEINPLHIFKYKGKYSPQLICENKCGSDTFKIDLEFVDDHETSIDEDLEDIGIFIYPNPSKGVVNIKLEGKVGTEVEILDVLGSVVYELKELNNGKNIISLSNSPNGVYLVKIKLSNNLLYVKKILLSK